MTTHGHYGVGRHHHTQYALSMSFKSMRRKVVRAEQPAGSELDRPEADWRWIDRRWIEWRRSDRRRLDRRRLNRRRLRRRQLGRKVGRGRCCLAARCVKTHKPVLLPHSLLHQQCEEGFIPHTTHPLVDNEMLACPWLNYNARAASHRATCLAGKGTIAAPQVQRLEGRRRDHAATWPELRRA